MASFLEMQLPVGISHGAIGGMRFNTSITTLSGGGEQRNRNWLNSRGEWDIAKALQTPEQIEELVAFFAIAAGKHMGWRFKDWVDYRCPRWRTVPGDIDPLPVLFHTTGGDPSNFQLFKPYINLAGQYIRTITKPFSPGVSEINPEAPLYQQTRLFNGVTQLVNPTDFTVNYTTGIVTLHGAIALTTGVAITGSFEFDVPARFDTDDQRTSITTVEIMGWPALPVVEIRDII